MELDWCKTRSWHWYFKQVLPKTIFSINSVNLATFTITSSVSGSRGSHGPRTLLETGIAPGWEPGIAPGVGFIGVLLISDCRTDCFLSSGMILTHWIGRLLNKNLRNSKHLSKSSDSPVSTTTSKSLNRSISKSSKADSLRLLMSLKQTVSCINYFASFSKIIEYIQDPRSVYLEAEILVQWEDIVKQSSCLFESATGKFLRLSKLALSLDILISHIIWTIIKTNVSVIFSTIESFADLLKIDASGFGDLGTCEFWKCLNYFLANDFGHNRRSIWILPVGQSKILRFVYSNGVHFPAIYDFWFQRSNDLDFDLLTVIRCKFRS